MILLIAFLCALIVSLLLNAWILATAARWLKSPRGNFKYGLVAAGLFVVISIGFIALTAYLSPAQIPPAQIPPPRTLTSGPPPLPPLPPPVSPVFTLSMGLMELVVDFLMLQQVFALRSGRALGLFGISLLWGCSQLALVIFVVKPHLVEGFGIPTASMSPTLLPADHIMVNKLAHPHRWDLVMYHPPLPDGTVDTVFYCKRLVGLPGEKLRFEGGNLFVNDQLIPAPAVMAGKYSMDLPFLKYREGQAITLAADEVFLVGDNVARSSDSRSAGPSKLSAIAGTADVLYWPMNRFKILR